MNTKKLPFLLMLLVILASCTPDNTKAIKAVESIRKIDKSRTVGLNREEYDQMLKDLDPGVVNALAEPVDSNMRQHLEKSIDSYRSASSLWDDLLQNEKDLQANNLMLDLYLKEALNASEFDLKWAAKCGELGLRCRDSSKGPSRKADELKPKVDALKKENERLSRLLNEAWNTGRRECEIAAKILGI